MLIPTIALIFVHAVGVFAQKRPLAPTLQASLPKVQKVYVAVLDEQGNPVLGLKAENFSVSEKGERRQILNTSAAESVPLVIGLLVDVSGSSRLSNNREEKLNPFPKFFMSTIGNSGVAFVYSFNDVPHRLNGLTNNLPELQESIKSMEDPRGSTALYDCLIAAAETLKHAREGRRGILVVFGDFQDTASEHSFKEAISELQETGIGVFVLYDVLHWPHDVRAQKQALKTAQEMAHKTGGVVYQIDAPGDTERALERILGILKNSYLLEYSDNGRPTDGKNAEIKVTAQGRNIEVLALQDRPSGNP